MVVLSLPKSGEYITIISVFFLFESVIISWKGKEVGDMLTAAFLIAIVIAFLYGFNFLGKAPFYNLTFLSERHERVIVNG